MPKLRGRDLVIEISTDGGTTWTDVGGESRGFSWTRTADEIDATVREDTAKDYLVGFADISAEMDGLVLDGAVTPAVEELQQGVTGDIRWFPEGKVATRPQYESTFIVTEDGQDHPYDGVVAWNVSMRLTSAIVPGTYTP
jgi:predicted secreted protein